MRGIKQIDGEMIITNEYGDHIISCPACKERGKNIDGECEHLYTEYVTPYGCKLDILTCKICKKDHRRRYHD